MSNKSNKPARTPGHTFYTAKKNRQLKYTVAQTIPLAEGDKHADRFPPVGSPLSLVEYGVDDTYAFQISETGRFVSESRINALERDGFIVPIVEK